MYKGFQMNRDGQERLNLETLRLLRMGAYVSYLNIPQKKGRKHIKLEKFYPLPNDRKPIELSSEEITAFFEQKDPIITNGKIRAYRDSDGNMEYVN